MMFVVPGEHPDLARTTETLATITGGHVTVIETRPYVPNKPSAGNSSAEGKRCVEISCLKFEYLVSFGDFEKNQVYRKINVSARARH